MPTADKIFTHQLNQKSIHQHAVAILKKLVYAGFEAYLVGGAVRDALQNLKPKDFDIVTNAHPAQIRKVFKNSRIIGKRFKLVHVYFSRNPRDIIEVATFRAAATSDKESSLITRDNIYGTLEQDAMRRDFTINALYYDWHKNCIIDFHNGIQDINNKTIRLIGDPKTRYQEDPVRMLRAIRFMAKLNFKFEPATEAAIKPWAKLLQDIPVARLYEEYLKLFHLGSALSTFNLLRQYNLLQYLFPQTNSSLSKNPQLEKLLTTALSDTDIRFKQAMTINPAYLIAVFLWQNVQELIATEPCQDLPPLLCFNKKISKILRLQRKSVSLPKYMANFIVEVWILQLRMQKIRGKSPFKVLEQAKYRAAYDFLCLRYRASEHELSNLVDWWSEFQDADTKRREQMAQIKP